MTPYMCEITTMTIVFAVRTFRHYDEFSAHEYSVVSLVLENC